MTIETGVSKLVAFKKEVTWNTAFATGSGGTWAATGGGTYLRRVTSDIDLSKDTYSSNEIRSDYQIADVRHGTRKVGGTLKGELSPGAYKDFVASLFRRLWTQITAESAIATVTVATTATTGMYSLTRGSGTYWAGNWKAGVIASISGAGVTANNGKNFLIASIPSATVMNVLPVDGTMTTGAVTTATISHTGKLTYTPETGHTNESYQIEHFYYSLTKSEVFSGCKVNSMDLGLPATGVATIDLNFLGADMNGGGLWAGTSQYFTTPTAAGTTGILTAVTGKVVVQGNVVGTITGLTIKVEGGYSTGAVVGANITPDVFPGRVKVTGQMTAYFDGVTLRDYFVNETSFSIVGVMWSDPSSATSDGIGFALPKCKALGATKSDGEQGLVMTIPFQALFNPVATATTDDKLRTTMMICDTQAT